MSDEFYWRGYEFYWKYRESRPLAFRFILSQVRRMVAKEIALGRWMRGFYVAYLTDMEE